jgi:Reverse transcriptase (RNA-dependent DNA polymerase)
VRAATNGRTEGVTSPGPILAATGDGRTGVGGAKPFDIPKKEVWEAFKKVRANGGAAGVDGESVAEFEAALTGNLYKLWNRLSSGSYLPPPVRRVDIPKPDGGTRPLGVPTVADRVAQEVVRRRLEPLVEPRFHPDSYGYRPGRSTPSRRRVSGAGASIGSSISTSRASSTVSRTTFS